MIAPPKGSPKEAATVVDESTIYVYLHSGSGSAQQQTWTVPPSWAGKAITATTITATGRQPGPAVKVDAAKGTLALVVQPGKPVVLVAK